MPIRVTHSSTTGSPFLPHGNRESPLPTRPTPVASPSKSASQYGGGGEWAPWGGCREGRSKVLDPEFLLHPQIWGGDQEFRVTLPLFCPNLISLQNQPLDVRPKQQAAGPEEAENRTQHFSRSPAPFLWTQATGKRDCLGSSSPQSLSVPHPPH